MEFKHISVLLNESIDALNIKPDGIYIDGTAGGAGHSREIAKRLNGGMLYALDRDPDAVKIATERLEGLPAKVLHHNFSEILDVLFEQKIDKTEDDIHMLETFKGADCTNRESIKPLIHFVNAKE